MAVDKIMKYEYAANSMTMFYVILKSHVRPKQKYLMKIRVKIMRKNAVLKYLDARRDELKVRPLCVISYNYYNTLFLKRILKKKRRRV